MYHTIKMNVKPFWNQMTKKFNFHSRKEEIKVQKVLDFHIKESLPWLNFKFFFVHFIPSASMSYILLNFVPVNNEIKFKFIFIIKILCLFYPLLSKWQPFYVNFPIVSRHFTETWFSVGDYSIELMGKVIWRKIKIFSKVA